MLSRFSEQPPLLLHRTTIPSSAIQHSPRPTGLSPMASRDQSVLPPELWDCIMQYCSPDSLQALALVSRSCCEDARKHLYRRLYFAQGWKFAAKKDGTRIHDLARFRRSLSAWPGWRSTVQHVRLCWTNNGSPHSWAEPERFETDAEAQLNDLVAETANLLAESAALQTLHLSIPLLHSTVPFALTRLDSLTIPITNCLHENPDFAALLHLFHIPSLKHVCLDQMLRLNVPIPEACRQPSTSDVTHLAFSQCGPIHHEIAHLLSWPRNLQKLEFGIDMADGLNRFAYDSGRVDMTSIREALWPLEECLEDLSIEVFDDGGCYRGKPLNEKAFQAFVQLRHLNVPVDMFLEFPGNSEAEPTLPINMRLPRSLEELVIQLESDFWWGDRDEMKPSEETECLFFFLSGLAQHKDQYLPNLKELRICRGFYRYGKESNSWLPLEFEQTRRFVHLLGSSGISVIFC